MDQLRVVHALDRDWLWPVEDTQMPADEFASLYREAEAVFLPALRGRRACVQAGGHVGVWPQLMTGLFDQVYSFEPDARNYHCLSRNAVGVMAFNAALGRSDGMVGTRLVQSNNRGTVCVTPGDDVPSVTIDSLGIDVDLIYLDVEGSELAAILGAKETIARCRPVVGVEVKFGFEAVDLLKSWGYRMLGRSHNDAILQC